MCAQQQCIPCLSKTCTRVLRAPAVKPKTGRCMVPTHSPMDIYSSATEMNQLQLQATPRRIPVMSVLSTREQIPKRTGQMVTFSKYKDGQNQPRLWRSGWWFALVGRLAVVNEQKGSQISGAPFICLAQMLFPQVSCLCKSIMQMVGVL